jgi:hypothetical protein
VADTENTRALIAYLAAQRHRTYTLQDEPDMHPQGGGPNHDVTYRDEAGGLVAIEEKAVYRAERMGNSNDHFARYADQIEQALGERLQATYYVYADEQGFYESVDDATIGPLIAEMEAALQGVTSARVVHLNLLGGEVRMHALRSSTDRSGLGMARFQVNSGEGTLKLFAEARVTKANKQLARPKQEGMETCLLLTTVDIGVIDPTVLSGYVRTALQAAHSIDRAFIHQNSEILAV